MQRPNRAAYTAAEFLDWSSTRSLVLSPKFQRRGVWQPAAKSFFIDTLLRSMPVPPVYLRMSQSPQKDKVVREVIDGQQRISAVVSFLRDEFSLSGVSIAPWRGKKYSQLTAEEQAQIRDYAFSAEVFSSLSDAEVLEIFSRLNTYSVKLNEQELRNGKFFGHFKQLVYKLALEHLEFWRTHGIFTERGIARMEEAELVSELLIVGMAGLQDKKKSIDAFYNRFDESFDQKDDISTKFRNVMGEIAQFVPAPLKETEFNRRPIFYTLFCAVFHRMYGIPGEQVPTPRSGAVSERDRAQMVGAIVKLSEAIEYWDDPDYVYDERLAEFVASSLRQTDNIGPRRDRFNVLYDIAFN